MSFYVYNATVASAGKAWSWMLHISHLETGLLFAVPNQELLFQRKNYSSGSQKQKELNNHAYLKKS